MSVEERLEELERKVEELSTKEDRTWGAGETVAVVAGAVAIGSEMQKNKVQEIAIEENIDRIERVGKQLQIINRNMVRFRKSINNLWDTCMGLSRIQGSNHTRIGRLERQASALRAQAVGKSSKDSQISETQDADDGSGIRKSQD